MQQICPYLFFDLFSFFFFHLYIIYIRITARFPEANLDSGYFATAGFYRTFFFFCHLFLFLKRTSVASHFMFFF